MKLLLPGTIYDGTDVKSLYQALCSINEHSRSLVSLLII
jgi:hypothetical protein